MTSTLTKARLAAEQEQPRHLSFRKKLSRQVARNKKWWWICGASAAVVLLIIIIVAATAGGKGDDGSNSVWKNKSPSTSLHATHVEFCGTWNDRLIVAGTTDSGTSPSAIEVYDLDENNNWKQSRRFSVEERIESLATSDNGKRVAVAVQNANAVRFIVFEETEGGTWNQYGEVIEPSDLLISADALISSFTNPTVILSNDGRTMVVTMQPTEGSLKQKIHVLKDVNSLGGTIGEVWTRLGEPLLNLHYEDHGEFATFVALSGDATKLIIASEKTMLAVYELDGEVWTLQTEYDESPVVSTGSLALSRDGTTLAVGSYKSALKGVGELHLINSVWPWFLVNEGGGASSDSSSSTSVQVSLSETGNHALVGRFPQVGSASLTVYEYNPKAHEWIILGDEFGEKTRSSGKGTVDLSDDALYVAAAVDGTLLVYELVG